MPSAFLVYNPVAGRFPSGLLAERAAQLLRQYGWELEVMQTEVPGDFPRLARQAVEAGCDAFFVVGGDGTVNLTLEGLVDSQTALGVLPAGTANVWAQELGLPGLSWTRFTALEESARLLATASARPVDVGFCNQRPFLLWAGFGLDAYVVHRIEPRSRWEKHFSVVQYAASAAWNASLWHGMNIHVILDGMQISGHYLLALVNNIHLYAGGLAELSPSARLDDGQMDLWLFRGENLGDTVQQAWDLLSGRHQQSGQVLQFPFRSLQLQAETPLHIQVDGEPVVEYGPVQVEVRQKALQVLVPDRTPRQLFE